MTCFVGNEANLRSKIGLDRIQGTNIASILWYYFRTRLEVSWSL